MNFSDYILLKRGYHQKKLIDLKILRRALFIVVSPYLSKGVDEYKIWPLDGDAEERKLRAEKNSELVMRQLNELKDGRTYMYDKEKKRIVTVLPNKN